jgi:Protein of unknown function (DUF3054)
VTRGLAALLDAVLVLAFAVAGRRSHAEGVDVSGILRTAWPFLAGAAAGWALASLTVDAVPRSLSFGAVVVVCTVVHPNSLARCGNLHLRAITVPVLR